LCFALVRAACAPAFVHSVLNDSASAASAEAEKPDWCKALPRAEYKTLERVLVSDPWFEVYKVAPDTFAIYEPHQAEETIAYLILGKEKALLFDTGMGISDIRKLTAELTKLPIIVLNSHTHDDHVGGNWQFDTIYSMDTDFTHQNAKGSSADAQEEIAPAQRFQRQRLPHKTLGHFPLRLRWRQNRTRSSHH
jgi:glyoxylase-like metal-dependent hydrolase (beta-lactamase superfamily II)